MIKFLLKGLLRDKSRSRLPVMVVAIGVMLTVFMHAYITGFMGDTIELNARFSAGHVKVMTRAYADNAEQIPNDLALIEVDDLMNELEQMFPNVIWEQRILFGGLIDAPDSAGETKSQGPVMGFGLDLLSESSLEIERLNIHSSLVRGELPEQAGGILISEEFSQKLMVNPGDEVTIIGSTMNGSLAMHNFIIVGTVAFGNEMLDRGAIFVDIEDVRLALDMQEAVSEIVGFLHSGFYDDGQAKKISIDFNKLHAENESEFTPVMKTLAQQGNNSQYVELSSKWATYLSMVFVFAMSLVLWNAGLLGGLRRYGEVGIRLSMGETKTHVYKSMIYESVMVGIAGSVVGTAIGLFFALLLQIYGIDIIGLMEGTTIMMPNEIRARITPPDFYIGFIPGVVSTVIGTLLAGIGIFKRQTARLFKELEA
jgi:putative ABC transport system permease protein